MTRSPYALAAHALGLRNARADRIRAQREARRREASLAERDRRWLALLAGRRDLRLNVGSSSEHIEGWISADIERDPEGRCLWMDIAEPWLFEGGAAHAITAEHVIEHVEANRVRDVLSEAFRVLGPGGLLRISTPDLEGLCRAFLAADPAVLEAHRAHGYEARTFGDLVNNYAYLWGHRHLWDLESLRIRLEDVGFDDIERATFGQSRHPVLRGIDRHDPSPLGQFVLIVDAVKPQSRS